MSDNSANFIKNTETHEFEACHARADMTSFRV